MTNHNIRYLAICFLVFLLQTSTDLNAQTLPAERSVDWTLAGLKNAKTYGFIGIDMLSRGVVGDGITPNDSILSSVLSSIPATGAYINFPNGNFLFNKTINLPSNVVLRGQGAESTTFTMSLGGAGHSISIQGSSSSSNATTLTESAIKDNNSLVVTDASSFSTGDWIRIVQNDSDLVTSSWAINTIGQIVKVASITDNTIQLESPLRMEFGLDRSPSIHKLIPSENVGIQCLKIHRIDDTAPEQASNIYLHTAANCWVIGVEFENCTYAHITAHRSSNLYVAQSYFHHAFGYGDGGRANGVVFITTTNECLVENNIFEHLRHSMILQSGANGNVFAYNYSFDPYWDIFPNNSAGDMVLHGNYVHTNLFEQNIGQNIVMDDSHGPNGPHNTFFRNRAESWGIFFSEDNSPNQNFLGIEIPNTGFPYFLVNYSILGTGHFLHGNNNKGSVVPSETGVLADISYAYTERPDFIPQNQWAGIGTPNAMGANSIPAKDRYDAQNIFSDVCSDVVVVKNRLTKDAKQYALVYPNPFQALLTIDSHNEIRSITIMNSIGQIVHQQSTMDGLNQIYTADWDNGLYFISIEFVDKRSTVKTVVKTD